MESTFLFQGKLASIFTTSFAVSLLGCFTHNPGKEHWKVFKHVIGYIKGTLDYGIMYKAGEELNLVGYVDSDFAGCHNTR